MTAEGFPSLKRKCRMDWKSPDDRTKKGKRMTSKTKSDSFVLWKRGLLILVITLFSAALLFFVLIPGAEIYSATELPEDSPYWMKDLDDRLPLSGIMIPGTHNSAAQYPDMGFFTKCQWDSISSQLRMGVRLLDLRIREENLGEESPLILVHGPSVCRQQFLSFNPPLKLERILNEITAFLDEHPSETVIVMVNTEESFLPVPVIQTTLDRYAQNDPEHWYLGETLPTLKEARGKIVLLRRWENEPGTGHHAGLYFRWSDQGSLTSPSTPSGRDSWCGSLLLHVQDQYHMNTEEKWQAFSYALQNTVEGAVNLNYLSTAGGASLGHPYYYAIKLNDKLLKEDLSSLRPQWIMTDFSTAGLIHRIYAANPGTDVSFYEDPLTECWNLLSLMLSYFRDNFALAITFILLICELVQHRFVGRSDTRFIIRTMIVVMVLSVMDFVELRLSFGRDYSLWRVITSVAGYVLRPITAFGLCRMVIRSKKLMRTCQTLLILNTLIYMTAFFSPLTFNFTAENVFERGSLGLASHVLSFFLVFLLLILSLRHLKWRNTRFNIVLILSAVMCIMVSILQTLGLVSNLLNLSIGISCIFFFMNFYVYYSGHDTVTGLPNRQSYYDAWRRFDDDITGLMFLDMNGLKELNDSRGHDAGDRTLRMIGNTITECLGPHESAYRIGGDEFTVILRNGGEQEAAELDRKIRKALLKRNCSMSIGYVLRKKDQTQDETERAADAQMYIEKKEYYRSKERKER